MPKDGNLRQPAAAHSLGIRAAVCMVPRRVQFCSTRAGFARATAKKWSRPLRARRVRALLLRRRRRCCRSPRFALVEADNSNHPGLFVLRTVPEMRRSWHIVLRGRPTPRGLARSAMMHHIGGWSVLGAVTSGASAQNAVTSPYFAPWVSAQSSIRKYLIRGLMGRAMYPPSTSWTV